MSRVPNFLAAYSDFDDSSGWRPPKIILLPSVAQHPVERATQSQLTILGISSRIVAIKNDTKLQLRDASLIVWRENPYGLQSHCDCSTMLTTTR